MKDVIEAEAEKACDGYETFMKSFVTGKSGLSMKLGVLPMLKA
jgi:hypothetical protein